MKRTFPNAAALLLSAGLTLGLGTGMARADLIDDVIAGLQAEGYTNIEIYRRATTIKVEATLNGRRIERVLDLATGEVLSEESKVIGSGGRSGGEDDDDHRGYDDDDHDDDHDGDQGDDDHDDDDYDDDGHDDDDHDDDHGGDDHDDDSDDDSDDDDDSEDD